MTHGPNLFDEIARAQRVRLPTTGARRKANVLAAATIKPPSRPIKKRFSQPGIRPGGRGNPERNPVIPQVPGTLDRMPQPVPEEIKKRFPHARDFS